MDLSRLKYAAVPTVTAPFGLALGGGAEVAMQGAACRAHAELYMGLVEAGVGLIPAGGGCKELLARALSDLPDDADPFVFVKKIFFGIAMAKVSMSAEEARGMGMLGANDQITFNRDYLLHDAKQQDLYLRAAKNLGEQRAQSLRIPVDDSLTGQVLRTGKPVRLDQARTGVALKVKTGFLVRAAACKPPVRAKVR